MRECALSPRCPARPLRTPRPAPGLQYPQILTLAPSPYPRCSVTYALLQVLSVLGASALPNSAWGRLRSGAKAPARPRLSNPTQVELGHQHTALRLMS